MSHTDVVLLTITATRPPEADWPATDLGYLLAKNPDRVQSFDHAFGRSQVFYPQADEAVCTAALLLEIDPIALVRSRNLDSADFSLSQYVNDRPYAASSLLAGALGQVFRTAIRGVSKERPQLAASAIPLTIRLPAVSASAELIERLFAPLGWAVEATAIPLDPAFPTWGGSRYCDVVLTGTLRLSDALGQLYVLLPVLDGSKHYWISAEEVDKLLRAGEAWLPAHPDRELITRRYLGRRSTLVRSALARLAESDEVEESELDNAIAPEGDDAEAGADPGSGSDVSLGTNSGSGTNSGAEVGVGANAGSGADAGLGVGGAQAGPERVSEPGGHAESLAASQAVPVAGSLGRGAP